MNNVEAHTLVLTNEELTVIFNALAEQPYKDAAPIIMILQNQIQAEMEERKNKLAEEAKAKAEAEEKK